MVGLRIKKIIGILSGFIFLLFFCACNEDATTPLVKDSEEKEEKITYSSYSLSEYNIDDYVDMYYTVTTRDIIGNNYLKEEVYSITIKSADVNYTFEEAKVRVGSKWFDLEEKGDTKFTYTREVPNNYQQNDLNRIRITNASGDVRKPNKLFNINYYVDDEIVYSSKINYGATPGDYTPTKAGYYFVKWDKSLNRVKQDMDVKAIFTEEITINYFIGDTKYTSMKWGKGLSLGDTYNKEPFSISDTFAYWYNNSKYQPFDFEKVLYEDLNLYAHQKSIVYGNGEWDLSIVDVKDCSVPRNYGDTFTVKVYSTGDQIIKVNTISDVMNLNGCVVLAVNGTYHNEYFGNRVSIIEHSVSYANNPYIVVRTSTPGYYYFSLVSKINNSGYINFDLSATILQ